MSVDHYENFPVASWLCPAHLRPAVAAIYWFARTADDLADEGDAAPAQRLADLAAYRADLELTLSGRQPSARWHGVFGHLAIAIDRFSLPGALLLDLLSAFEQDVVKHDYADRGELLDYCRRSANPVGRLMLHLHGIDDAVAHAQSDAICTGLQLINFWQDVGIDAARGRLYLPRADRQRYGVNTAALLAGRDSPQLRALIAEMVGWSREMMASGAGLAFALPGRAGLEMRLVVQGGLRILQKIERSDHATLLSRSALRWFDWPLLAARALAMRPQAPALASTPR